MDKRLHDDPEERLLDGSVEFHDCNQCRQRPDNRRVSENAIRLAIVSLLVYIAAVLTFLVASKQHGGQQTPSDAPSSHSVLPKDVVQYEDRPEWEELKHPWSLEPSDELDMAWKDLLYAINIRITPSELDELGENKTNRVQVNGGDYAGVLGVYHHLHCLNNLRRLIHWDYYGPRLANTKHPEGFAKEHSNHCIDAMRQTLLCHANTAIYTVEYTGNPRSPVGRDLKSRAVTKCVNWDALNGWARQRALVPGQYSYILRPTNQAG
ncbi:hypothetical protein N656DRAFT_849603 [Canariomyces notabilis]|uniref:Tat pathway signal sequence n=1 Tax=Canariomyces notabilis TaxID=2074819 RepID=A0AAN6QBN1_9PEZI|nr:hypothetical protein N656DRAFT_849603 [Canariomyces arenarius]